MRSPSLFSVLPILGAVLIYLYFGLWIEVRTYILFVWHCFIVPLGDNKDQKARLDKFYQGQADVYDETRAGLLRGRNTMLSMSAAHLRVLRERNPKARLVWVDIGGGTGWNIEAMDAHFPVSSFDAIYVVDLCQSLLNLAQERFASRGWSNVTCICQDASTFYLPEWSDGIHPRGSVGFVSLSYSLSMIPAYHSLLDKIDYLLDPSQGLLSVVDFYTAGKETSLKADGGVSKTCSWFTRWFWQIWFDFDHVDLSPGRRDYLEYRFGTIKTYNGRNKFIAPLIVRIPYYIWIGCSRSRDTSRLSYVFEVEGGNKIGGSSPLLSPTLSTSSSSTMVSDIPPPLSIGERALESEACAKAAIAEAPEMIVINVTPPLSPFHYQLKHIWRLPYVESPMHSQFRTFIYSFTWEDPEVDMLHLELTQKDTVFAIASAGDNVLHYAINAQPARIHAVDMNPCQGHLVELKLAAIKALEYEELFAMFGEGKIPNFRQILDSRLSPYLSSPAYQFWRINVDAFETSFYRHGYSGWALRIAGWLLQINGMMADVRALCAAQTLQEQDRIWTTSLRKLFVEGSIVQRLVDSPVFLWNALGVPKNQKDAFTNEGSVSDFIRDTLDPIGSHALLSKGAYHYLLCLLGKYTRESCPDYLTRRGFEALKADDGKMLDSFRLHTDSINKTQLTFTNLLGTSDWFAPESEEALAEVVQLHRVLPPGGMVFWRSAAKCPWYNETFKFAGFKLTALGMREGPHEAIDRVNMYASFWRAVKV
ncbi:hypothetical protein OF83DRAFT_1161041 [Amylostereum chailletii]|nr:hypothetical protein OF83DRAFT_1161041 [Amylostereum chailletii]